MGWSEWRLTSRIPCGVSQKWDVGEGGMGKVGKGHGARETREVRGKGCGMRAKIIILQERVYEIKTRSSMTTLDLVWSLFNGKSAPELLE